MGSASFLISWLRGLRTSTVAHERAGQVSGCITQENICSRLRSRELRFHCARRWKHSRRPGYRWRTYTWRVEEPWTSTGARCLQTSWASDCSRSTRPMAPRVARRCWPGWQLGLGLWMTLRRLGPVMIGRLNPACNPTRTRSYITGGASAARVDSRLGEFKLEFAE